MADARDVQRLLSAGVNTDMARTMSKADAAAAVKELAEIRPMNQGRLFS